MNNSSLNHKAMRDELFNKLTIEFPNVPLGVLDDIWQAAMSTVNPGLIAAMEGLKYLPSYDNFGDAKVRIHVNVALDKAIALARTHGVEKAVSLSACIERVKLRASEYKMDLQGMEKYIAKEVLDSIGVKYAE